MMMTSLPCEECGNRKNCGVPCFFLEKVLPTATVLSLSSKRRWDVVLDNQSDYKEQLMELQYAVAMKHLKSLQGRFREERKHLKECHGPLNVRAIAGMRQFGLEYKEIARAMKITERRVHQIVQEYKKKEGL